MATKIRLQRNGRKGRAIFTIVVSDSRAKRDGRYIERIGQYNPNTNPATIDLAFDRALDWVLKGAEMSDTARAILSYKGVMMKKHLLGGVAKGALTNEQADAKFTTWLESKENAIDNKKVSLASGKENNKAERLTAEAAYNAKRAAAIVVKNTPAPVVEEVVEEDVVDSPSNEEIDTIAAEEASEATAEVEIAEVAPEATIEATTEEATVDTAEESAEV